MAKRTVTVERLREIVAARRAKGLAFTALNISEYKARMAEIKGELASMSKAEIMARWPELTYDIN